MSTRGTEFSLITGVLRVRIRFAQRPARLLLMLLAAIAFVEGCSGLVSQNTQQAPTPQTYSISGTISPAAGGNGATVTLSGAASATATANGSGAFAFSGLPNGTYTLTPSHTGYTFNPTSQNVTVSGANVTGVNITATVQVGQTFTISGTISPTAGGSGVAVALSGAASATTTSNSSGAYTFTGLANGAYIVTPSNARFTFTPANQSVSVNGANVSGLNFTATTQASSGGGGSGGSWIHGDDASFLRGRRERRLLDSWIWAARLVPVQREHQLDRRLSAEQLQRNKLCVGYELRQHL